MILDHELLFDSASATTVSGASTNIVDLVNARDMGIADAEGATPKILALVTTAFTSTDSGTLTIQAEGSTDSSSWSVYAESRAYTTTELVAGAKLLPIDWPHRGPGDALPRYIRLNYVVANHFTAGALTAGLVLTRDDIPAYPSGFTVDN